ncbi:MAG: GtrA family protein [Candidatus Aenigmarchaeota archaeon]|nr:GtrA family protein [Candidatus Aenigmarchaeota archaeon]
MKKVKKFVKKEEITPKNAINPKFMFRLLYKHKYIHFFSTGVTGVIMNLFTVWFTTEFIFGLENYFYGYLVGLAINLTYNFTAHTILTFKTKTEHVKRFIIFITYSLVMSFIQAVIIKTITPIIGLHYYIFVIAGIIFIFSIFSFLLFKVWMFKDKK